LESGVNGPSAIIISSGAHFAAPPQRQEMMMEKKRTPAVVILSGLLCFTAVAPAFAFDGHGNPFDNAHRGGAAAARSPFGSRGVAHGPAERGGFGRINGRTMQNHRDAGRRGDIGARSLNHGVRR
jgi:hypothetical protein